MPYVKNIKAHECSDGYKLVAVDLSWDEVEAMLRLIKKLADDRDQPSTGMSDEEFYEIMRVQMLENSKRAGRL